jgi:4-hydroxy-3-polyprenylbenzoate decarboxylase
LGFRDLRQFVKHLEKRGQLKRISVPVDAELEITEITDRISKGPSERNVALLFENVAGCDVPVLINMFGSERRMAWALGVDNLNDLGARLSKLIAPEMPTSLGDKLRKGAELLSMARIGPKVVKNAPCQEVVVTDGPSLDWLPILKCWPLDAGRYITLPLVITRDPLTGRRNVGMYRLQVFDHQTLGMHWQLHKGGAEHERLARERGLERIPVAIALGGDPATIYTSSAPLPPDVDEFLLAGWLRGSPLELVRCVSIDLEVPAHSEIVLEGYVDPTERRTEGPFGDHTGYYSLAEPYPVFHLTAITHRRDPIYPTTIVGRPPMEDYWLGKATERLFLPLVRLFVPEVVDMNMPAEGVFHNLLIVSMKKRYPGHVRKVVYGLWGMGLMSLTKHIVVVDDDVDVHNLSEVAWRVANNIDVCRDLILTEGPVDALDHASLRPNFGGKLGIDATRKGPDDGHDRPWPPDIVMDEVIRQQVSRRWKAYGLGG